ncbi:MAG: hypothetical protein J5828_04730, partial [Desulfovibrionaceae bacterium]|nr:hypothetical protein [Desulfovibrionaceae bacterium]
GSGKTSLMQQIKGRLCDGKDAPYYGVWIRAWEHSAFSAADAGSAAALTMASMLNSMIREILPYVKENMTSFEQSKETLEKAYGWIKKLPVLSLVTAGATGLSFGTPVALSAGSNDEKETPQNGPSSLSELRNAIKENIRFCIERDNKKQGFIFFIDDLDRLVPKVAVQFLELLKNIFDIDNCLFVLAIDYEVVVKGLKDKFGDKTESNEHEFRSFFDKIIQVPFRMPVDSYKMERFLQENMEKIGYLTKEEASQKFTADDEMADRLGTEQELSFLQLIGQVVAASCGPNPRSVIRMLNTLSLIRLIQKRNGSGAYGDSPAERTLLFALIALQMNYDRLYELIGKSPDFSAWDSAFASENNLAGLEPALKTQLENLDSISEEEPWTIVVARACRKPGLAASAVRLLTIILALVDSLAEGGAKSGGHSAEWLHARREAVLGAFMTSTSAQSVGRSVEEALPASSRSASQDAFMEKMKTGWQQLSDDNARELEDFISLMKEKYGSAIVVDCFPASSKISFNFNPERKKGGKRQLLALRVDKKNITLIAYAYPPEERFKKLPDYKDLQRLEAVAGLEGFWEKTGRYLEENVWPESAAGSI